MYGCYASVAAGINNTSNKGKSAAIARFSFLHSGIQALINAIFMELI